MSTIICIAQGWNHHCTGLLAKVCFGLLVVCVTCSAQAKPVQVFLLAGQSNMRGIGNPADLDGNKVSYEMAGMLWLQGESDARSPQRTDYEKNLTQFIAHMRATFKTPGMPFIIARVKEFYGGKEVARTVRDAQMKIGRTDGNAACIDTDDCEMHNEGHYNSAGLITIGKRFADALDSLKRNEREINHE